MITGRPKPELTLAADEQTQLRSLTASRTLPHALVARAKVVLWSAQGQSNTQIARRVHWRNATVGKWRQRFVEHRLAGLYDELRPGRPRSIEDEQIAEIVGFRPFLMLRRWSISEEFQELTRPVLGDLI